jgi:hypothetical protein
MNITQYGGTDPLVGRTNILMGISLKEELNGLNILINRYN